MFMLGLYILFENGLDLFQSQPVSGAFAKSSQFLGSFFSIFVREIASFHPRLDWDNRISRLRFRYLQ